MEAQGDGNQKEPPKPLKILKDTGSEGSSSEDEPELEDTGYDYDQCQDLESDNDEATLPERCRGEVRLDLQRNRNRTSLR
jgi:hypothetical protein